MCRIASLFQLQRLKGSTSSDVRNFNNIQKQAVIEFFILQRKGWKETHDILTEILGEHALPHATVKNWVAHFKQGDFSTSEMRRPGWQKTVITDRAYWSVQKLIL
jgi:hypothetical protein